MTVGAVGAACDPQDRQPGRAVAGSASWLEIHGEMPRKGPNDTRLASVMLAQREQTKRVRRAVRVRKAAVATAVAAVAATTTATHVVEGGGLRLRPWRGLRRRMLYDQALPKTDGRWSQAAKKTDVKGRTAISPQYGCEGALYASEFEDVE